MNFLRLNLHIFEKGKRKQKDDKINYISSTLCNKATNLVGEEGTWESEFGPLIL